MAWSDAYATAVEYRNRIDKSITTDDGAVLIQLTAISRHIERKLSRVFNQTAAGVVRYFNAIDSNRLIFIDDLVATTELAVDTDGNGTWETIGAAADTYLRPYNAAEHGQPFTSITLTQGSGLSVGGYAKSVRITGTWGWPSVPADIKEATIQLTAILRLETQRAQATITELGGFVQASPQARNIIQDLLHQYDRTPVLV